MFFPEKEICLALFELGWTYADIRNCLLTDAAALVNEVYRNFPDYAVKFNIMEQCGGDSPLRRTPTDVALNV